MHKNDIHELLANGNGATITHANFELAYGEDREHHQTKQSRADILALTYNLSVIKTKDAYIFSKLTDK